MSWRGGRQIEIGLGGLSSVSLAEARDSARKCRRLVREGRDPREATKTAQQEPTFGDLADDVITAMESGWRNDKHRQQWRNTLKTYAAPIWTTPVDLVTTEDVVAILRPIWTSKAETASRVRGRIEKVLDAAMAKGFRSGENPARWRGHLDHLLSKRQKLQRGHHAALPWRDLPQFMTDIRNRNAVAALACEFLILTAARSGEILRSKRNGTIQGMRWEEVDFDNRVWTVPAIRMKAGIEHRVPLSDQVIRLLKEVQKLGTGDYVFPGPRPGHPLSEGAITALLKRMGRIAITVHGFRSTFRDWVYENTNFSGDMAEAALAHVTGSKVERAYRRGDALERRRELMQAWADYCGAVAKPKFAIKS